MLICGFLALIFLRIPVAFALGLSTIPVVLLELRLTPFIVLDRMFQSYNSFILLAVPFFLLAANLMNSGKVTDRLIELARVLTGWLPGGLGHVNVAVSMLFAGISGSSTADAAGIGKILIPAMQKEGYDTRFAVAISSFGKSQLSRWADFSAWERLHVVHCGIEPARFDAPASVPQGALRLAAIGRFVEQKGQMILLQSLGEVVKTHPQVHLSLIGDGEMRADLEAAITDLGLQSNVTLTGWLPEAGVRQALAESHALVMPSFAEGLPMVVMEAMAAARPVIATYIAGTPELVQDGKTGWMVPAGDADALAGALDELAKATPQKLTKMGDAGRVRALARHDVAIEAAKLASHII